MDNGLTFPRFATTSLREALEDTPVVVIQGARQVGKSTLAHAVRPPSDDIVVVTLDDPLTRAQAEQDPAFFVTQAGHGTLVIDEAQRVPSLILPLKASVDRDRRPGRFLLTGSADLLRVKGVGDSLAGRAETIELKPFSQGELARRKTPEDFVHWILGDPEPGRFSPLEPERVIAGGYPVPAQRMARRAASWFDAYIDRLADHDASELATRGYSVSMRKLLELIAVGGQQEVVPAKVARTLGISPTTVDSYLRQTSVMRLITVLPPWTRSLRGRVARRPKIGLNDTGLSAALTQFTIEKALTLGGREYYGALVEQFVVQELAKQRTWSRERFSLYHYRELDGLEVDLIVELADGRLLAIEVKSSQSPTERSWRNLVRFRERVPDRDVTGVCFYTGTQVGRIADWLHLLPVTSLWEHADNEFSTTQTRDL